MTTRSCSTVDRHCQLSIWAMTPTSTELRRLSTVLSPAGGHEHRCWPAPHLAQRTYRQVRDLRLWRGPPPSRVRFNTGLDPQPELEERMRKMRSMGACVFCFTKKFEPDLGEAAVWLQTRGTKELYVSAIVALNARRSLTVEQHNQVLEDFEKSFIEPSTRDLRSHVFNYQAPAVPTLEDMLSTDSMRRLRAFSATANKAMPQHVDLHRWHVFIARTHLENSVIDPTLLSNWLQGEGWHQSKSQWLVEQFKIARAVLSVYDDERSDR